MGVCLCLCVSAFAHAYSQDLLPLIFVCFETQDFHYSVSLRSGGHHIYRMWRCFTDFSSWVLPLTKEVGNHPWLQRRTHSEVVVMLWDSLWSTVGLGIWLSSYTGAIFSNSYSIPVLFCSSLPFSHSITDFPRQKFLKIPWLRIVNPGTTFGEPKVRKSWSHTLTRAVSL